MTLWTKKKKEKEKSESEVKSTEWDSFGNWCLSKMKRFLALNQMEALTSSIKDRDVFFCPGKRWAEHIYNTSYLSSYWVGLFLHTFFFCQFSFWFLNFFSRTRFFFSLLVTMLLLEMSLRRAKKNLLNNLPRIIWNSNKDNNF